MAVAAMFVAPARVTAIVRVFRFAACALAAFVTPEEMVTLQRVRAGSTVWSDIKVIDAVADPEFAPVAVNVVEPQPLVVGVTKFAIVVLGKVTTTVSSNPNSTFNSKVHVNEDAFETSGLDNSREL
jgi:hypothetical protein